MKKIKNNNTHFVPLSVAIIACKADEHWLPRCLASLPVGSEVNILWNSHGEFDTDPQLVTTVADDLLTVNNYSMTYSDELISFSRLRNICSSLCTREWILWIDCDEEYFGDTTFVDKLIDHYPDGIGGLICGVYGVQPPYGEGEKALRYMTDQVRIFRNNRGFQFDGTCHEQITWSIQHKAYQLMDCSVVIQHRGYRVDRDTMKQKMLRNTKLLSQQVAIESDEHRLLFFLDLLLRDGKNFYDITKQENTHASF